MMDTLQKMSEEMEKELLRHIIPFWESLKDERGGFCGEVTSDLTRHDDADKGVILHSRILWFFSRAYLLTSDRNLLADATHAYQFLTEHCFDDQYGGVYWTVHWDGTAAEDMKHAYNQAFAIYGLTAYYEASGERAALEKAYDLYQILEGRCIDHFGYLEAFSREWGAMENDKLSEDGYLACRTMNTLLHVIEAYTELFRVGGEKKVKESLRTALELCLSRVYDPRLGALYVFFNKRGHNIAEIHSYGHDIEAAWLLDRACEGLQDEELTKRISDMSLHLTNTVLSCALEPDGGVNNQCCRGVIDKSRVWWVQAESIVGCVNAYQKTSNSQYLEIADRIWQFLKDRVIDRRPGGEWYWQTDEKGVPDLNKPIAGAWKCPYHNGRMCMEVMQRCIDIMSGIRAFSASRSGC